jgi:hypothetical protein
MSNLLLWLLRYEPIKILKMGGRILPAFCLPGENFYLFTHIAINFILLPDSRTAWKLLIKKFPASATQFKGRYCLLNLTHYPILEKMGKCPNFDPQKLHIHPIEHAVLIFPKWTGMFCPCHPMATLSSLCVWQVQWWMAQKTKRRSESDRPASTKEG